MRSLARALLLVLTACSPSPNTVTAPPPAAATSADDVARAYVRLVLALGEHDANYVDAYYGPPEWRAAAATEKLSIAAIQERSGELRAALGVRAPAAGSDELVVLRHRYLDRQLAALGTWADRLAGTRLSFDEEAQALYDARAPRQDEHDFEPMLAELERTVPGDGLLAVRLQAFRDQFAVPAERVDAVFRAALGECRARTLAHLALPAGESFTVEYVTGKPWGAYNWYQGGFRSLIQVNTSLPLLIDRAIDLACHEGYPGHHVYNTLLEEHLVRDRGWVEYSVYPLFSPQSLIAEGTAEVGIDVAFPGDERTAFERDVLYPLAGLDPGRAATYSRVADLVEKLGAAGNTAARRYLDGEIDRDRAAAWLERYALLSPARAIQRVAFLDTYRSYVINYNVGRDLVRAWVEGQSGGDRERRWRAFGGLLASPRLPSDLRSSAAR